MIILIFCPISIIKNFRKYLKFKKYLKNYTNEFLDVTHTKKEIDLFLEKGVHSVLKKPVDPDALSKFVYKLESER